MTKHFLDREGTKAWLALIRQVGMRTTGTISAGNNEYQGYTIVQLHASKRLITSPYGLLGNDENALTYALAYTFQQCPHLLQWFLKQIGIPGIHRSQLRNARIDLQRHSSQGPRAGITDIEIHLPSHFHVIVEAKVGLSVPSVHQSTKYLPRLRKTNEPKQKIVALVQSPGEHFVSVYTQQKPALAGLLTCFNWSRLIPICIRMMLSQKLDESAKNWVRAFYRFLDEEYTMKAFTTEVWILSINTKPLWKGGKSHWDIHKDYRVWWDYKETSVRPLYLAFRFDGTLEHVARINRIEHGRPITDVAPELALAKNPVHKRPATIWHFDELIKLPKPLPTGPGMFNHRTRCDFDLLLTCSTVKEIESTMTKRNKHAIEE
ncbi:MAG TPA: hypothetical protein DDZ51_22580 [Planctomycetaceae bacterium]|nr:hypothetical protein [Planctomycetaceae bacterium]